MKYILIISLTLLIPSVANAQVKELHPHIVRSLNLSEQEAKLYNVAFEKLFDGIKLEELADAERKAIEHGDETKGYWETVGSGCSWYCGGGTKGVSGSSFLQSQGTNTYAPSNAHDFSYKNAWVEGVAGYGVGEYLEYSFGGISPRITEIIVVNGYIKSAKAYRSNSRVKKLKVYVDDKPYAILNLRDIRSAQYFKVEPLGTSDRSDWKAMEALPDWKLKFEILEAYKGDKYDDTAISEIYFDGLDVHCFAAGTQVLMANGKTKAIEKVKKGDVIHFPFDYAPKLAPRVKKVVAVEHDNLVTYTFESGATITATQDHPFMLQSKGWSSLQPEKSKQYKAFDDVMLIEEGDAFETVNGTDKLVDIRYLEGKQMTYTISKIEGGSDRFVANGFIVGVEVLDID